MIDSRSPGLFQKDVVNWQILLQKSAMEVRVNCLDILKPSTARAQFGGGAFEAVSLTTAMLTQHKRRPSVVA